MAKPGSVPSNLILRSLQAADAKAILPALKRIHLSTNTVIYEPGERVERIYFPEDSVISFHGDTGEGGRIEVWSVGADGLAGISAIVNEVAPYRGVVQVSGEVLAADAKAIRRQFDRRGQFHDILVRYTQRLLVQIAQLGLCNAVHEVDQRFCRWLLIMQDRTGLRSLAFTQDFIAGVLGTRRATISVAAAALQRAGLIGHTPGEITILSRRGLQAAACSCYKRLSQL